MKTSNVEILKSLIFIKKNDELHKEFEGGKCFSQKHKRQVENEEHLTWECFFNVRAKKISNIRNVCGKRKKIMKLEEKKDFKGSNNWFDELQS